MFHVKQSPHISAARLRFFRPALSAPDVPMFSAYNCVR